MEWSKRNDSLYDHLIEEKDENGVWVIRNKTERILTIHNVTEGHAEDKVELQKGKDYRVENIHFAGTLLLEEGQLELRRVEADKVQVDTFSTDKPVLTAEDCLFDELSVGSGIARLESCTILGTAELKNVDATDSILMNVSDDQVSGTIQYSRIPDNIKNNTDDRTVEDCTSDKPLFFGGQTVLTARAVLAPNTPQSIHGGAGDGGEMGYFHKGRKGRPACVEGNHSLAIPATGGYPLEDIVFQGEIEVSGGKFVLIRSTAESLTVSTALSLDADNEVIPALTAKDCLFDNLTVASGLARLEYCTVMGEADCKHLQASDCIFAGSIINVKKPVTKELPPPFFNCVRYSNIPAGIVNVVENEDKSDPLWQVASALRLIDKDDKISPRSNTLEKPVFIDFDFCENGELVERAAEFGDMDYGVLDPATSDTIRFGAEDGGEMGACHHKYYSLKAEAVLDKMREFLPVGIEPVLIQDTRLLHVPPEQTNTSIKTDNGEES